MKKVLAVLCSVLIFCSQVFSWEEPKSYADFSLRTEDAGTREGRMYYNATDKAYKYYNGTSWKYFGQTLYGDVSLSGSLMMEQLGTATTGTTTYNSGYIAFESSAYDTNSTTARSQYFKLLNIPTSANDVTAKMSLQYQLESGGYSEILSIANDGDAEFAKDITVTSIGYITSLRTNSIDSITAGLTMHISESGNILWLLIHPAVEMMGVVEFDSNITLTNTTPKIDFKDNNALAGDVNAEIIIDATDTGDGSEDVDVQFKQQVAGSLVSFLIADADVGLYLGYNGQPTFFTAVMTQSGTTPEIDMKDTNALDGDVNFSIVVDATDTGSGTEDIDVAFKGQSSGALVTFINYNADGYLSLGYNSQPVQISGDTDITGDVTITGKITVTESYQFTETASTTPSNNGLYVDSTTHLLMFKDKDGLLYEVTVSAI